MSGDEVVGVVRESIGGRKARCSIKICLVSWEWGQRIRSGHSKQCATELGMELGVLDMEKRWESEDLKQTTCSVGPFASLTGLIRRFPEFLLDLRARITG